MLLPPRSEHLWAKQCGHPVGADAAQILACSDGVRCAVRGALKRAVTIMCLFMAFMHVCI
eukprot:5452940-Alexandrium_andersonii.AAC.1